MADVLTKAERARCMAAIRSSGNKGTEQRLIAIMRAHKITGWRRHWALVFKPDFVFPALRAAIFVDGCFWHGCAKHCRMPRSNVQYWRRKIGGNMARDKRRARELARLGWRTVRIWEHELRHPGRVARKVFQALEKR